jgi:hypothetical protein
MNRYEIDLSGLHERASATLEGHAPRTRVVAPAPAGATAPDGSLKDATLRGRQDWFGRAVMTPESHALALTEDEARQALTPGPRLSALERLDIYRRGYHARLIECLADDYPSLQHALGPGAFDDLCRVYIERHPSGSPSLNYFGRHMAELCRTELRASPVPFAFCADLATLEWAIVEVIHAPSSEPLTVEGLEHVPADKWGEARLVANTALRVLRFAYPINAYFQALRESQAPEVPGRKESATVVYRSGPRIWRMDLTGPMFEVLSALLAGETLGDSLGRVEETLGDLDEQQTVERVMFWFREWVGSGLFVKVEA